MRWLWTPNHRCSGFSFTHWSSGLGTTSVLFSMDDALLHNPDASSNSQVYYFSIKTTLTRFKKYTSKLAIICKDPVWRTSVCVYRYASVILNFHEIGWKWEKIAFTQLLFLGFVVAVVSNELDRNSRKVYILYFGTLLSCFCKCYCVVLTENNSDFGNKSGISSLTANLFLC